jgi:hypothetical protein
VSVGYTSYTVCTVLKCLHVLIHPVHVAVLCTLHMSPRHIPSRLSLTVSVTIPLLLQLQPIHREPVRPPGSSREQAPKSSTPAPIKLPFVKREKRVPTTVPSVPPASTAPAAGSTDTAGTSRVSSVASSVVAAVRKSYSALLLILLAAALGVWIWGVTLSGRVTGCPTTVTGIALMVSHITLGISVLATVALLIAKCRGRAAQSSTVLRILKIAAAAALVIATAACGYVLHILYMTHTLYI